MPKVLRGFAPLILLVAGASANSSGRLPPSSSQVTPHVPQPGANKEQLRAASRLATSFAESWNRRDGRAYGEAYWPEAELVDPSGQIWSGRTAIIQTHVALWRGPARATHMTARIRRVRPLSPSLFIVDIDTSATGFSPPPPGATGGVVDTRLKHVVQRRGALWKIIASQNTFIVAPR